MLQSKLTDMYGETTKYAVTLGGKIILTVRQYTKEAEINAGESDPYMMSISYLAAEKKGITFLLTEGGFTEIRSYTHHSKTDSFRLNHRENKVETVDHLFSRFEYDVITSPYLRDIDFDNRTQTVISKEIYDLPDDCRDVFREQYAKLRDALSYSEKLKQQIGKRNDPIEVVVSLLHSWDQFTLKKLNERFALQKNDQSESYIFANIPNKRTQECGYVEAVIELQKIKKQLSSGRVEEQTKIKIQARLPRIKKLITESERNKQKLADEIEDLIEENEPEQIDYGFREFGYGQKDKHQ